MCVWRRRRRLGKDSPGYCCYRVLVSAVDYRRRGADWMKLNMGCPLRPIPMDHLQDTLTHLLILVITTLVTMATSIAASSLKLCNTNEIYRNLTQIRFTHVGNETVWTWCDFPNPRTDWQRCGRPNQSWLCDPDGLLTEDEGK